MAKEKIVRCQISKIREGAQETSVRFVPHDLFPLWKMLMTDKHGFSVNQACVSLWFDIDGDPNVTYSDSNYEKVVRVSVWIYSEKDGMFRKVTRYFPSDSYNEIKPRFLAHYADHFDQDRFAPRIEEAWGVWLKREE